MLKYLLSVFFLILGQIICVCQTQHIQKVSFVEIVYINNIMHTQGNLSEDYLFSIEKEEEIDFDTILLTGRKTTSEILSTLIKVRDTTINEEKISYWATISIYIDTLKYEFLLDKSCHFLKYKKHIYFDESLVLYNYFFDILYPKIGLPKEETLMIEFGNKFKK